MLFLGPGLLMVNPVRPCLKINDEPMGWEYFSKRGWDVVEVPPPTTIDSKYCLHLLNSLLSS